MSLFGKKTHHGRGVEADKFGIIIDWSPGGYKLQAYDGPTMVVEAHGTFSAGNDFKLTIIKTNTSHQGKGFGSACIGALIGAARARKCTSFVFEGVAHDNAEAIKLYQGFGAVHVGQLGAKNNYRLTL